MITKSGVKVNEYADFIENAPLGNTYRYDKDGNKVKIDPWYIETRCPSCGCIGQFNSHGFYHRGVATYNIIDGFVPLGKLRVQVLKCKKCAHSHAILPEDVIPYRYIILTGVITSLCAFFVGIPELEDVEGSIPVLNEDGSKRGSYKKPLNRNGRKPDNISITALYVYFHLVTHYLAAAILALRTLGIWTLEANPSVKEVISVLYSYQKVNGIHFFQFRFFQSQRHPYLYSPIRVATGYPPTGYY